jgi:hypothetical protein
MNHPSERKSAANRPRASAEPNNCRCLQQRAAGKHAYSHSMMIFAEYSAEELLQILMEARNAYYDSLCDRTKTNGD